MTAGEEQKNAHALQKVLTIMSNATWINIHSLPVSNHNNYLYSCVEPLYCLCTRNHPVPLGCFNMQIYCQWKVLF